MNIYKARINLATTLAYFNSSGVPMDPALLSVEVADDAGDSVAAPAVSQNVSVPDLYVTGAFTVEDAGNCIVTWTYDGSVLAVDSLEVGVDPTPDYGPDTEVVLRYQAAPGSTYYVHVLDMDGEEHTAIEPAVYSAANLSYEVDEYEFDGAGTYYAIWYVDVGGTPTPAAMAQYFVGVPVGLQRCVILAASEDPAAGGTPLVGARVVVSDPDGVYMGSAIVNDDGLTYVDLPTGSYVMTLVKASTAYSVNNFECEVVDSATSTDTNVFNLFSDAHPVVESNWAVRVDTCQLYGRFVKMDGQPLVHAAVQVSMVSPPTVLTGNTVYGRWETYHVDNNGYVSFELVQGLTVDIAVTPLGLRRRITVPSGVGAAVPVDFMTLVSGADDIFDILTPSLPAAPRRTL